LDTWVPKVDVRLHNVVTPADVGRIASRHDFTVAGTAASFVMADKGAVSGIFSAVSGGDSDADAGDGGTLPGDTPGWGMRSDGVVDFAAAAVGPLTPLAIASDVQAHLASVVARAPHLAAALSAPLYVGASPRNTTLTFTLARHLVRGAPCADLWARQRCACRRRAETGRARHSRCGCGRERLCRGAVCWWLCLWP